MELMLQNLTQPPVLFFALGLVAALVKSDLEPVGMKLLVVYLLVAIGLRGGVELSHGGMAAGAGGLLVAATICAFVAPLAAFVFLRRFLEPATAAATAAAYGSVSAVTFLAADTFADSLGWASGGYMVAALALMEWPAILVGVYLAGRWRQSGAVGSSIWKKCLTCGSVMALLGALGIGLLTGEAGWSKVSPFFHTPFSGVLCLFLLGLGIDAGRSLGGLRSAGWKLPAFAISFPLVMACAGVGVSWVLNAQAGDALLFTTLFASASYIAVPAAMRLSLPEADPGVYLTAALAVTFPFNILCGIPLYSQVIEFVGLH